ncbi:unnamed protein product [Allacma fusca]|uniref:Uncharacterized protein n=1 Tax=Allacma fusca TaxID=39272 RepID=A0A8J2LFE1_9HEXA|nr:unnamed protein product [Allacma fusca]
MGPHNLMQLLQDSAGIKPGESKWMLGSNVVQSLKQMKTDDRCRRHTTYHANFPWAQNVFKIGSHYVTGTGKSR